LSVEQTKHVEEFDDLVDRVADWAIPDDYLRVVEALDRQPVLLRAHLGAMMHDAHRNVLNTGKQTGSYARLVGLDRIAFTYDLDYSDEPSNDDESQGNGVVNLAILRHVQALETGAPRGIRTVAVWVRDHVRTGARRYAFATVDGSPTGRQMESWQRAALETTHGLYDDLALRIRDRVLQRNEPCPCGSGRKYKHCHLRT
jgi:SEC-C motif